MMNALMQRQHKRERKETIAVARHRSNTSLNTTAQIKLLGILLNTFQPQPECVLYLINLITTIACQQMSSCTRKLFTAPISCSINIFRCHLSLAQRILNSRFVQLNHALIYSERGAENRKLFFVFLFFFPFFKNPDALGVKSRLQRINHKKRPYFQKLMDNIFCLPTTPNVVIYSLRTQ